MPVNGINVQEKLGQHANPVLSTAKCSINFWTGKNIFQLWSGTLTGKRKDS